SSANEHVENADTRGAEIAQNEPLPIEPLENADTRGAEIAQNEPLPIEPLENEIEQLEPFLARKLTSHLPSISGHQRLGDSNDRSLGNRLLEATCPRLGRT